jgi:hypothetical protein
LILVAHVKLNANVASIYSARGNGLQGHLAMMIDANDYVKRSIGNKPFVPPTAPSAVPTHLTTASDAQIAETNCQHKFKKRNLSSSTMPTRHYATYSLQQCRQFFSQTNMIL